IAWRWTSADRSILENAPAIKTGHYEATPIMVNGVLYVSTSLSQVAALDPVTGRTLWLFEPHTYQAATPPVEGFIHRGVAYWTDGREERILFGTGDAYLIALDARTGQPVPGFGRGGRVDLLEGLRRPARERRLYSVTSPPVVCRDVVVIGSCIADRAL